MDRITSNFLEDFVKRHNLDPAATATNFEHFANYCIFSDHLTESFNLDEVAVGYDGNPSIDGLGVLINGELVTTYEDAEAITKDRPRLDIDFVFVQAKTSPSFSSGDMSTFGHGVIDFFQDVQQLAHNEEVKERIRIKEVLYQNSAKMINRLPSVHMYYVTTGSWQGDQNLQSRITADSTTLREMNLFSTIGYSPWGAKELQDSFRATQTAVSAEFLLRDRVTLPAIPDVAESHIGVVKATELVRLIRDKYDNIRKPLFYENVRDFQKYNDVNSEIRHTLTQDEDKRRFVLMNNGVTIVAKSVQVVGDKFSVIDFQVVNGCQTCHVLHENANSLTDDVLVPLKVIATTNKKVSADVIRATNRQTEVTEDQLYATNDFQKDLEAFYSTFRGTKRLYYERRSKQYQDDPTVDKIRIVKPVLQKSAFASMFLDEAHRGHYARSLDNKVGNGIFNKNHKLEPYFASAFALFKLEYFFRRKELDSKYKPARYHLLMVVGETWNAEKRPAIEANAGIKYWSNFIDIMDDDAIAIPLFKSACQLVDKVADGKSITRDQTKTQHFTAAVRQALLAQRKKV